MSEELQSHYHRYYLFDIKHYYNKVKSCMIKDATFKCMVCGKTYHERYEYKPPPDPKSRKLEKQKKKYGNRC